jgi:hypothetical protein
MAKRKYIDWDSIEPLYRAGVMSLNDICNQYQADHINSTVWKPEVKHNTICEHANKKKWSKNLANKVKERVQEKLTTGLKTSCLQSDEAAIESASEEPVRVALGQRARTHRLLKDQDDLAVELRRNKEKLDVMSRVRGFKDISAAVKSHHADQADQYKLNDAPSDDKSRIKVSRNSADE